MSTALVEKRRVDYTCRVAAHTVPLLTDGQGNKFVPVKIVAEVFLDDDKARVKVSGHLPHGVSRYRSATFNLTGFDKNRPCPEWLVPVIRYLGYGGAIHSA